jgi:hypothetical protein
MAGEFDGNAWRRIVDVKNAMIPWSGHPGSVLLLAGCGHWQLSVFCPDEIREMQAQGKREIVCGQCSRDNWQRQNRLADRAGPRKAPIP